MMRIQLLLASLMTLSVIWTSTTSFHHTSNFLGADKPISGLYASQSGQNSRKSTSKQDVQYQGTKGTKSGPVRNKESINFVAEWQSRGDHYVSYDNLVKLDNLMTTSAGKSKNERSSIMSELSTTYFAR